MAAHRHGIEIFFHRPIVERGLCAVCGRHAVPARATQAKLRVAALGWNPGKVPVRHPRHLEWKMVTQVELSRFRSDEPQTSGVESRDTLVCNTAERGRGTDLDNLRLRASSALAGMCMHGGKGRCGSELP